MSTKQHIYITGLPRSGSTLLCQLLGHHPDIYSTGHSSPLCAVLDNVRHTLSDNPFLLSQMDVDFERVSQRLTNLYQSIISGWFKETDKPVVVDKNRAWLRAVELLNELDPNFKMIVCIRDPQQIFGSIEKRHSQTRVIDFPDHMSHHSAWERAQNLFGDQGVVGEPLKYISNMQDIDNPAIKERLCYLPFESVIKDPEKAMGMLFEWLDLPKVEIDFNQLSVRPHESDSYYRFKYSHQQFETLNKEHHLHQVPKRIADYIEREYQWFYEWFYNKDKDSD